MKTTLAIFLIIGGVIGIITKIFTTYFIKIVKPPERILVEMWGGNSNEETKYTGFFSILPHLLTFQSISFVLEPGWHIWIPVAMKERNKVAYQTSSYDIIIGSEEGYGSPGFIDFEDEKAGLRMKLLLEPDNVFALTYNVDDAIPIIAGRVEAEARELCAPLTLDEALSSSNIPTRLYEVVDNLLKVSSWGLKLKNLDDKIGIEDYILTPETEALRQKGFEARKKAEAAITSAEAQRTVRALEGEGEGLKALNAVLPLTGRKPLTSEDVASGKNTIPIFTDPAEAAAYAQRDRTIEVLPGITVVTGTDKHGAINVPTMVAGGVATANAMNNKKSSSPAGDDDDDGGNNS